jgi:protein-tyrosine phosphatase
MEKQIIDIHSHILYAVDDGAKSLEESLEMIRLAYEGGTRQLVLTPHYEKDRNRYNKVQLQEKFDCLQKTVKQSYPDIHLYLGNEILYEEGIVELLKKQEIYTLNGTKYVLVEFSPQVSYSELYRALKELIQARFRPIIAHVERYFCLQKKMDRIYELREMGTYLQMNGESIPGKFFSEQARWCRKLLKEEQISFIGSDAHDCENRSPILTKSIQWMLKNLEDSYCEQILFDYPQMMLENRYLDE